MVSLLFSELTKRSAADAWCSEARWEYRVTICSVLCPSSSATVRRSTPAITSLLAKVGRLQCRVYSWIFASSNAVRNQSRDCWRVSRLRTEGGTRAPCWTRCLRPAVVPLRRPRQSPTEACANIRSWSWKDRSAASQNQPGSSAGRNAHIFASRCEWRAGSGAETPGGGAQWQRADEHPPVLKGI